jgi:hypothetical protein
MTGAQYLVTHSELLMIGWLGSYRKTCAHRGGRHDTRESFVCCGDPVLYGEVNLTNPAGEDLTIGIALGLARA